MSGADRPQPACEDGRLTSGGLLARNAVLNLGGQGLPLLVALAAIPPLVRGLGEERFGMLTIAWMVIGYFSLFDLGLGRALTQLVASRLGTERDGEIPALAWTAFAVVLVLGVLGGVLLYLLSPWVVVEALRIPRALHAESLEALRLLAMALPWVIATIALRGVLEALQRFDLVNLIRAPLGVATFLGPLLLLPYTRSLVAIVGVLVVARMLAFAAHLWLTLRALPALRAGVVLRRAAVRPLLRFGGWMTVSNVVSPLMVSMDRFVIGAVLGMTAVTYYVTPYEVVTKLLVIPVGVLGVLFPAFATSSARDSARTALLADRGTRVLFLVLLPIVLVLVTFAPEMLGLWLGPDFAVRSAPVVRWLAVGVLINGLAQVPFAVVQGVGRPDLTGRLHLLELPVYAGVLYFLLGAYGIVGAAIAWVLRVAVDTAALFVLARRLVPGWEDRRRGAALAVAGAAALVLIGGALVSPVAKGIFLAVTVPVLGWLGWGAVLTAREREIVRLRSGRARREIVRAPSG